MVHPGQHHHPDISALPTPTMSRGLQHLVNSARHQQPSEIIKQVHKSASMEYHVTKKKKQQELRPRVLIAQREGDKAAFKNAKKKVDNHASSVASRSRRAFLISSFETLVSSEMEKSARLAELVLHQNVAAVKREDEIRCMSLKVSKLAKLVDSLKSQNSKSQSHAKSASGQQTRERTWNPEAFAIETMGQSSRDASAPVDPTIEQGMEQFSELDRTEMTLPELGEAGAPGSGNALTSYLDRIGSETTAEGSQPVDAGLKMDNTEWGQVPMISREFQQQMKADAPDNVFYLGA